MKIEDLIKRVDELIQLGQAVIKTEYETDGWRFVDSTKFQSFRSASLSFLLKAYDREHPYYVEFDRQITDARSSYVEEGLGILQAVHDEMVGGWTLTVKGLISAEVFADFLDMASYLLEEGYKDAAAVMAGSVLEEHLRQLCHKGGIEVEIVKPDGNRRHRKADSLNADLAKQGLYSLLDQKSVIAWLDLRNKAAHGKYNEYTKEQVILMIQGITEFMARVTI